MSAMKVAGSVLEQEMECMECFEVWIGGAQDVCPMCGANDVRPMDMAAYVGDAIRNGVNMAEIEGLIAPRPQAVAA